MDLSTSIASMAMSMSQAKLQQDIGVSVLKKAMDTNAQAAQSIVDMMAPAKPSAEILAQYSTQEHNRTKVNGTCSLNKLQVPFLYFGIT